MNVLLCDESLEKKLLDALSNLEVSKFQYILANPANKEEGEQEVAFFVRKLREAFIKGKQGYEMFLVAPRSCKDYFNAYPDGRKIQLQAQQSINQLVRIIAQRKAKREQVLGTTPSLGIAFNPGDLATLVLSRYCEKQKAFYVDKNTQATLTLSGGNEYLPYKQLSLKFKITIPSTEDINQPHYTSNRANWYIFIPTHFDKNDKITQRKWVQLSNTNIHMGHKLSAIEYWNKGASKYLLNRIKEVKQDTRRVVLYRNGNKTTNERATKRSPEAKLKKIGELIERYEKYEVSGYEEVKNKLIPLSNQENFKLPCKLAAEFMKDANNYAFEYSRVNEATANQEDKCGYRIPPGATLCPHDASWVIKRTIEASKGYYSTLASFVKIKNNEGSLVPINQLDWALANTPTKKAIFVEQELPSNDFALEIDLSQFSEDFEKKYYFNYLPWYFHDFIRLLHSTHRDTVRLLSYAGTTFPKKKAKFCTRLLDCLNFCEKLEQITTSSDPQIQAGFMERFHKRIDSNLLSNHLTITICGSDMTLSHFDSILNFIKTSSKDSKEFTMKVVHSSIKLSCFFKDPEIKTNETQRSLTFTQQVPNSTSTWDTLTKKVTNILKYFQHEMLLCHLKNKGFTDADLQYFTGKVTLKKIDNLLN